MKTLKELVPCCVCGNTDCSPLYADELGDAPPGVEYDFTPDTRKTYAIVQCSSCGHIYTNPMPFLDDVYINSNDEEYVQHKRQRIKCFEVLHKTISKYCKGGDFLDIGCATGLLLDVVAPHFDTTGVELSANSRSQCDPRHKVFPSLRDVEGKQFDVITLLGVIEHLRDPNDYISFVARSLKPGGLFVLYTGDVGAWLPRLLKKRWWWYQGMHLHYFSKATLSQLLKNHGMRIDHAGNMPLYFELASLSVSLRRYPFFSALGAPILNMPLLKDVMVPMGLSGEMVLFCVKTQESTQ